MTMAERKWTITVDGKECEVVVIADWLSRCARFHVVLPGEKYIDQLVDERVYRLSKHDVERRVVYEAVRLILADGMNVTAVTETSGSLPGRLCGSVDSGSWLTSSSQPPSLPTRADASHD